MTDAHIVHRMRGRTRLRVRDKPGGDYFATVEETLASCAAVRSVQTRAATGSILIRHDGELDAVLRYAAAKSLFTVTEPPSPPEAVLLEISRRLDDLDGGLRQRTKGRWDLPTMTFYALMGTSFVQLTRGQFLPAGGTLAVYALMILRDAARPRRTPEP